MNHPPFVPYGQIAVSDLHTWRLRKMGKLEARPGLAGGMVGEIMELGMWLSDGVLAWHTQGPGFQPQHCNKQTFFKGKIMWH